VIDVLGVRSALTCPLQVVGERRGVLQAVSAAADAYTEHDQRFLEAVARWIGMVTHRTELFEQTKQDVADQSRRAAVDELISLLTPRQREVAALIASGLTNAQIAERLVISAGTVANHVEHILDRLGAQRRAQVAAWIAEAGLRGPSQDGRAS
jgi:DNA-binding NarL/FixJ family response regulator